MANTEYSGFSDESLENALAIKNSIEEIQDSTSRLNRTLRQTSNETGTFSNLFNEIKQSANQVASIQEKAARTTKGTVAALQQQAKQQTVIRQLNVEIDRLYDKASKATGATKLNLERQARNLAEARDNARELSKSYGQIAQDSANLTKSASFFSQLSEVAGKIPLLNKFASPFEKAAEAARKTALDNAKTRTNLKGISDLQGVNLKTGKGLTAEKLKQAGLDQITQGKTGKQAGKLLQNYQQTAKVQSQLGAGIRAAGSSFSSMGGMLGKAGWIGILITALEFIKDLFIGAQERTVEIAKDLSITRDSADAIRKQYVEIAGLSGNLLVNSKSLIEAQQAFTEYSLAGKHLTSDMLENQVFLTKNLGISVDKAADFNYMMDATGQNIEGSTNMVADMGKKFTKITGLVVPTAKVLKAIANTSKEIQGYFGFSVKNLAQAVMNMSKFGLELSDALSLSKSLLDFESSINNELELELLTGKGLNLERARALAMTGKIDQATTAVLDQMQNLTEEQRKSPLIMESMSKVTGLSADALNRAYLVNKKLNKEARDYYNELVAQGRVKDANYLIDIQGEAATKEEMMKTLTAQDAFNAALEKAKDQFSGLVSSGVLDSLVDAIHAFVGYLKFAGIGSEAQNKRVEKQAKDIKETQGKNYTAQDQALLTQLQEKAKEKGFWENQWEEFTTIASHVNRESALQELKLKQTVKETAQKALRDIEAGTSKIEGGKVVPKQEVPVKDFVLKPMDQDTITMAGGTKLGGNVEELLKELIVAVKQGQNIYIGANKLNESIGLNLHSL
jgi:hypothetical protein